MILCFRFGSVWLLVYLSTMESEPPQFEQESAKKVNLENDGKRAVIRLKGRKGAHKEMMQ